MVRTLRELLAETEARLRRGAVDQPRLEARLLLEHATGIDRTAQLAAPEREIDDKQRGELARLVDRRLAGEPLGYLIGRREFYGLDFEVGSDVLIPRPESELIVDIAREMLAPQANAPLRLADLGTGSGCLLVSLLTVFPHAWGVGTDLAFGALVVARRNARRHEVDPRAGFVCTRWCEALGGPFDLVVSNPPYLTVWELAASPPELAHEPSLALDAGADGLRAYRALAQDLGRIMRPDALALIELAAARAHDTAAIFAASGLRIEAVRQDLAGRPRVLVLRAPR